MSKTTTYIIAFLACGVYWALFVVILVAIGGSFDKLGILWKILLFWMPIVGIWKGVTSLAKKDEQTKEKQKDANTEKGIE